ncbi:HAD family hydrolase [Streptomyces chumphonensis]|uniref:HAD family hydrolase n=1 Tax=Streptomyces chumphonensis TaxID=1214925 RepID=A0A927F3T0_9ACTN|nr:HAD family hydrolase [Streptomyces chumphonensis]MBD3933664.1 HAD family hydrolase [Streptomyces chumphonensis]
MNHPPAHLPPALAHRPEALLLDFGGVVFHTEKRPEGRRDATALLHRELATAGHAVPEEELRASLDAGLAALKDWKNAAGRRRAPVELTHREIWEDFLASDLPEPVRAVLAGSAGWLLGALTPLLAEHTVRPGVRDLLHTARRLGVRVGIVSNAHAGRSHRALLREHGLEELVDVQLYSDEVGVRKPHPAIVERAARALATRPERCWFVGDTLDRDVAAGRRAGVAAVVVTRDKHTDRPPYPVAVRPDAVFDTPEGLVPVLAAARDTPPPASPPHTGPQRTDSRPAALLLDHGGVIANSVKDTEGQRGFGLRLAARLRRAGHDVPDAAAVEALTTARRAHQRWKGEADAAPLVPEVTPVQYWQDFFGTAFGPDVRAWLAAEAVALSHEWAHVKSRPTLREGAADLLGRCRELAIPVAVVSNTVCGRSVRERMASFGIAELVGVHVYSDELGRRKPDPLTVREALRALAVDPGACWFAGDKPGRDMAAARSAGIGTTVLVRGGSLDDAALARHLTTPGPTRPDHVVTSLAELLPLLSPRS